MPNKRGPRGPYKKKPAKIKYCSICGKKLNKKENGYCKEHKNTYQKERYHRLKEQKKKLKSFPGLYAKCNKKVKFALMENVRGNYAAFNKLTIDEIRAVNK